MADSGITKKALASAIKELLVEMPFSKITVGDICDKCEMNRKSFYYHFKDKYDLVNRIYYTEFLENSLKKTYTDDFEFLLDMCIYLERNKNFYRKVLKFDGQNSFLEYLTSSITPIIQTRIEKIFENSSEHSFYTEFFSDAFVNAIIKWVLNPNAVCADEFIRLIRSCIYGTAKKVLADLSEQ